MGRPHVAIYPVSAWERTHTHPANMSFAPDACHVIASRLFFDVRKAVGTTLDIVGKLPLLVSAMPTGRMIAMLLASEILVILDVACGANATETRATFEDGAVGSGFVDLRTIGRGTVVEFRRAFVNVREESALEYLFLLVRRENFVENLQGYWSFALAIAAQTCNGKRPRV